MSQRDFIRSTEGQTIKPHTSASGEGSFDEWSATIEGDGSASIAKEDSYYFPYKQPNHKIRKAIVRVANRKRLRLQLRILVAYFPSSFLQRAQS